MANPNCCFMIIAGTFFLQPIAEGNCVLQHHLNLGAVLRKGEKIRHRNWLTIYSNWFEIKRNEKNFCLLDVIVYQLLFLGYRWVCDEKHFMVRIALAESYVNYGSSFILSKVRQIISLSNENIKTGVFREMIFQK